MIPVSGRFLSSLVVDGTAAWRFGGRGGDTAAAFGAMARAPSYRYRDDDRHDEARIAALADGDRGRPAAGGEPGLQPMGAIRDVTTFGGVELISSNHAATNVGAVTSQADVAIKAAAARGAFGVDGTGVTIGVLSDSFNNLGGAGNDILSGDLPAAGVTVLSDMASGGSDEGRAMLQLIHDLAPGADLMFHTAFNGAADFAQGIIDLANAGADIIVDDVFYFAEPSFQDGNIAQAVDQVTGQGVLYFSSAGNQANRSYESAFDASGVSNLFGFGEQFHDFNPGAGVDVYQSFTLSPNTQPIVTFQWDQPYSAAWAPGSPGSASNMDLFLLDTSLNLLGSYTTSEIGGDPWIGFQFNPVSTTTTFNLAIGKASGPDPGLMKYAVFGSGLTVNEYMTGGATTFGHSNAEGTFAVGAAYYAQTPAFGVSPPRLESFSSLGGTPILFDTAGNRLATPDVRDNVDFVAPDGTVTTVPGFGSFFGTSAAAPHAAAVAALMLELKPTATRAEIEAALESTAIDMDNPFTAGFDSGFDRATGAGLIQADLALAALGVNTPPQVGPISVGTFEDFTPLISVDLVTPARDPDPGDVLSVSDVVQTSGPAMAFTFTGQFMEFTAGQFNWLSEGQSVTMTFDYSITDQTAVSTSTVTVLMGGRNDATTDLLVSATSFEENAAFSATLGAVDPDLADTFTYGLASDPTGAFQVAGDQLSLTAPLDFEALPAGFTDNGDGTATATVGLSVSDGLSPALVRNVAFTVNDVAEGPPTPGPPQVVEVRVSRGIDDAEQRASGRMYMNSSDLELVEDRSIQTVGVRFEGAGIPQGAVITRAYLQFQADETDGVATSLTIHGEAADNAASFASNTGNITARPTTAAAAAWAPAPWTSRGEAGAPQQTADLSAVVQEIVDRPGWAADNGIAFIISGAGTRVAESYEGKSSGAALLHVEYEMPGSGGAGPTDIQVSATAFDENGAFSATLAAVDADSTVFTYGLAGDPTGAFQVVGDQLSLTGHLDFEALPAGFTDNGDGTATATLGLSANDGSNPDYVKTVAVTVGDLNDNAPTDLQVSATGFDENTAFSATLSATDPDSAAVNAFTYGLASDPTGGAFQVVGDQVSLTGPLDFEALPTGFTNNGDGTATATLGLSVSDGANPAFVKNVAFTVNGVNDNAPVVGPLAATTNEDALPLSLDLLATASDPDAGDVLSVGSVVQTGGPAAAFSVTGGILQMDPSQFNGLGVGEAEVFTFAFNVSDQVNTTPATATVTVEGRNDAPVLSLVASGTSEDLGLHSVDILAHVSDPDVNDVLSVVNVIQTGGPAAAFTLTGTGFQLDAGQFNWLSAGEFALPQFDYFVSDQTVTVSRGMNVSVFGINDPTTDLLVSATSFDENAAFSVTLSAVDPDLADTFTYGLASDPTGGAFQVAGAQLSLTAPLDFEALPAGFTDNGDGTANVTLGLSVSDGLSPAVVRNVAFTVNDVPEANSPPVVGPLGILTNEDHPVPVSVDLASTASDPDPGDVLSLANVVQTGGPAMSFAFTNTSIEFSTGQFNWLSVSQSAQMTFDYSITDQTATSTETLTVTVDGRNDPTTDLQVSATSFDENAAFIATLSAVDPDLADTFAYGMASDPSGAFQVIGNQVSLIAPLDFEALPAAFTNNGDGTATATVGLSVSDRVSPAIVKNVNFTVNDVPDTNTPPVVGPLGILTNEDHPIPVSVDLASTASDPDAGDVLSLSNVVQTGGPAMAFTFTATSIEFSTGQFNWLSAGQSAQMTFDYSITDQTATSTETLTVTVEGRNDATTDLLVSATTFDENAAFNATLSAIDPDLADTFLYGIPGDPTGAFRVIGNQLSLAAPLDFEALPTGFTDNGDGTATATVGLSASDGTNPAFLKNVNFTVNDLNDNAPFNLQVSATNFDENAAFSATLSAVDVDSAAVNAFTYGLASDPTGAFRVIGNQLSLTGLLDFEALPTGFTDNGDGTATATLGLSVSDGANPAFVKNVAFAINDVNDNAPSDLQVSATSFDENAAFSATLSAVDADSAAVNTFTYALTSDPTGAFQLAGDQISLVTPLDFENLPAGFFVFSSGMATATLGLSVSDGAHPALVKNVAFTISDVPENSPPVVPWLSWGALEDNLPVSIDLLSRASDPNPGDVLSISSFVQTGGPTANFTVANGVFELDTIQFDWVSAGQLLELDFDYDVTDQIVTTTSTLNVTIIGENDPTTGVQVPATSFNENAAFSTTLTAIDPDLADTFTYGLTRDPSGAFQLVGDQLSLTAPLDFEDLPPDFVVLGDGTATVTLGLSATDEASPAAIENVTFTVNDLPDAAPTELHASSTNFDENGAFNATLNAANGSGAAFTYALVGDPTGGAFQVVGDQLSLTAPLDFEALPAGFTDNGNGSATVTTQISADDGTNPALVKNVALMVNDLNDNAPTGLSTSGSVSVEDGYWFFYAPSPRSPDTLVAADADSDAANNLTYTLTSDPTGGAFQVVGGKFFKTAPLDFEALPPGFTLISVDRATVDLEIVVDDGVHAPIAEIFQFQVTDRNDNSPTGLQVSASSFDENAAFSTTLTAVDPDSAPVNNFSYVMVHDPTGGAFQIVGDQLSLIAPLDFEALPPGFTDNGNGTATVVLTVSVSDGATPAPNKSVTLTINDVDETNQPPTDILVSTTQFDENAGFSATLNAVDPDLADTFTYGLASDPTGGAFQVIGDQVSLVAPLDFEALPAGFTNNGDGTATAAVGLSVDDGVNPAFTKNVDFTVNDLNDNAPSDIQVSATGFDENAAFSATLSAADADSAAVNSFTYGLASDPSGAFQVIGNQVSLIAPLDFEALPAGFTDNGDGTATTTLGLSVYDGANPTFVKNVAFTVNGVNDNPPVVGPLGILTNEDHPIPVSVDLASTASDPDPGDVLSLSNVVQTGGPAMAFTFTATSIEFSTGQFNWLSEGQTAQMTFDYSITDQTATSTETLTVTVDGRNDATTDLLVSATSFDENGAFSTTLSAVDPDLADAFTYGIASDPTGGAFQVTGDQLSLAAPLDFEALPAGFTDNGDGTATAMLGLSVDDGANPTFVKTVAFTVNDVAEAPPGPPQVVEVRVARGIDDAEEWASGRMYMNSSDLELVEDRSTQTVGVRFEGAGIPQGAVITKAYLQFQADETDSGATSLTIHGEAADSAASFANVAGNISGRATTVESATWEPAPWTSRGEAGPAQQTADLSAVVQEIVDRPGWAADNGIAFLISGAGTRVAESYEGKASGAALLHVEFTVPAAAAGEPAINADVLAALETGPVVAVEALDADPVAVAPTVAPPAPAADILTGGELSMDTGADGLFALAAMGDPLPAAAQLPTPDEPAVRDLDADAVLAGIAEGAGDDAGGDGIDLASLATADDGGGLRAGDPAAVDDGVFFGPESLAGSVDVDLLFEALGTGGAGYEDPMAGGDGADLSLQSAVIVDDSALGGFAIIMDGLEFATAFADMAILADNAADQS